MKSIVVSLWLFCLFKWSYSGPGLADSGNSQSHEPGTPRSCRSTREAVRRPAKVPVDYKKCCKQLILNVYDHCRLEKAAVVSAYLDDQSAVNRGFLLLDHAWFLIVPSSLCCWNVPSSWREYIFEATSVKSTIFILCWTDFFKLNLADLISAQWRREWQVTCKWNVVSLCSCIITLIIFFGPWYLVLYLEKNWASLHLVNFSTCVFRCKLK